MQRVAAQRPQRVTDHRLITLTRSRIALHGLAQRTDLRLDRGHALAAAEAAQPAAQPAQPTAERHVVSRGVTVQRGGGVVRPPDLADDAGHRPHQVAVARQHLLRGQRPVVAAAVRGLGARERHHRPAHRPRHQPRVTAPRALGSSVHGVVPGVQRQGVQRTDRVMALPPHPAQPGRRHQHRQLQAHGAPGGQRGLGRRHRAVGPQGALHRQFGPPVPAQPVGQTVPAGALVRPEDRPGPRLRAAGTHRQPGPPLRPVPGVECREVRGQIVVAEHQGEIRRARGRAAAGAGHGHREAGVGACGAQSVGRTPAHGQDLDGRPEARRGGPQAGDLRQIPERGGRAVGRRTGRGAVADQPGRRQLGHHRAGLHRGQLPCRLRQQCRQRPGPVEQRRDDLGGPAEQRGDAPPGQQIGGLVGHHLGTQMAAEADEGLRGLHDVRRRTGYRSAAWWPWRQAVPDPR